MIAALYTGLLNLHLANSEINEGTGMFPFIDFLLATTAIIIVIICYPFLLFKLKPANESSEFSELLQETYKDLSVQRRMDLLEKIKEERIKEYLDRKKQKFGGS